MFIMSRTGRECCIPCFPHWRSSTQHDRAHIYNAMHRPVLGLSQLTSWLVFQRVSEFSVTVYILSRFPSAFYGRETEQGSPIETSSDHECSTESKSKQTKITHGTLSSPNDCPRGLKGKRSCTDIDLRHLPALLLFYTPAHKHNNKKKRRKSSRIAYAQKYHYKTQDSRSQTAATMPQNNPFTRRQLSLLSPVTPFSSVPKLFSRSK